jgi:site-specific recombinase XerD
MKQKRLLVRLKEKLDEKGYSKDTKRIYRYWIIRFIKFNNLRHPDELGKAELVLFLEDLRHKGSSKSSLKQTLSALRFLYGTVLEHDTSGFSLPVKRKPRTNSWVGKILGRLAK